MTSQLFDKDQWDNEDCVKAWDRLCAQHAPDEVFWAVYGGLLKKDLKLQGWLSGLKQHYKEMPYIEIDLSDTDFEEDCLVRYEPDLPVEGLRQIVESFVVPPEEQSHYQDIYTDKQLSHVKMRLELSMNRDK
jgi:hypothetical protein